MYSRTALLVVPVVGGQHLGFILNRATDVKMATLFPEHAPSTKIAEPLYFGGPEMAGAIFAVVPRNPGGPALHLFDELFVTGNGASVDGIIESTPNDARYFVGYVGWARGELAAEIERGFWYLGKPDAALLFSKDTGRMWDELVTRLIRSGNSI
jgi:putative transcriptional regulator